MYSWCFVSTYGCVVGFLQWKWLAKPGAALARVSLASGAVSLWCHGLTATCHMSELHTDLSFAGTLALAEPRDACSAVRLRQPSADGDAPAGQPAAAKQPRDILALLDRGGCSFVQKARPTPRLPCTFGKPP